MVIKCVKWGVIGMAGAFLVGGVLFGKDVVSYVKSSAKSVRTVVKDSVPIEFELRRARDMLDDIIPEMRANVRLIAQEEVEVAALKTEIVKSTESLEDERCKIMKLRAALNGPEAYYCFGSVRYTRDDVKADLAGRFERIQESEVVLGSKQRLLTARERSLAGAMQLLEKTKARKRMLEDQIETLESRYRLAKAAAVGSQVQIDNSKLAQTERLIDQIKKRLDVAERVLAHESRFVESIPVDAIVEQDLLAQVDEYFQKDHSATAVVNAAAEPTGQVCPVD